LKVILIFKDNSDIALFFFDLLFMLDR